MGDIKNPKLIIAKGLLFVLLGLMACAVVLLEAPKLTVVIGLVLAIWAFCRFYYFAFYVIEHYIDPSFKFAGLTSVVTYLFRAKSRKD